MSPEPPDPTTMLLARDLLDHQIVDASDDRSGKADDVILVDDTRGRLQLAGVVSGPAALARRHDGLTRWIVRLGGRGEGFVAWEHVRRVNDHIELASPAHELGLAHGEHVAADLLDRILAGRIHQSYGRYLEHTEQSWPKCAPVPDGARRLSRLLSMRVNGVKIRDVLVRRTGQTWCAEQLVIGNWGVAARLGIHLVQPRTIPVAECRVDWDANAIHHAESR